MLRLLQKHPIGLPGGEGIGDHMKVPGSWTGMGGEVPHPINPTPRITEPLEIIAAIDKRSLRPLTSWDGHWLGLLGTGVERISGLFRDSARQKRRIATESCCFPQSVQIGGAANAIDFNGFIGRGDRI